MEYCSEMEIVEKYSYNFDSPHLTESGCVEISKGKITITFPENKNSSTKKQDDVNLQNILLFINNQLIFSNYWLPYSTLKDVYKVKDMISKCYFEFLNQSQYTCSNSSGTYLYDSLVTNITKKNYSIQCYEDYYSTSIEINLLSNKDLLHHTEQKQVSLEIFIGNNKIFCSNSLFKQKMSVDDYNFLINFMLIKLLKQN